MWCGSRDIGPFLRPLRYRLVTQDEPQAQASCPRCGADGGSDGFCSGCGATLDEQPIISALVPGARFLVDAETIELIRRETEGDWSARSETGRYYFASEWSTPRPGPPTELVPAQLHDLIQAQDVASSSPPEPVSVADALIVPLSVSEPNPIDTAGGVQESVAGLEPSVPMEGAPVDATAIAQAASAEEASARPAVLPIPVEETLAAAAAEAAATDSGPDIQLRPAEPPGETLRIVVDFLSTVRHPSLPASFLVGRHPQLPFDILFVEYDPTSDWLASRRLVSAQACRVGGQLAQLLSACHAAGTSLVGLRPEAVRWSADTGRATVVRLEGVSPLGSATRPRTWGIATAPEILIGDPITPAADVYSLGILLASSLGMISEDTESLPNGTLQICGDGHLDLSSLVMRCTSSSPAERPGLQHVARELGRLRGAADVMWAAESSIGRVRDVQEDSWAGITLSGAAPDSSLTLVAVADGMGGAEAGEIASRLAVRALVASFTVALQSPEDGHQDSSGVDPALATAFSEAAAAIRSHAAAFPDTGDLGTTLTAVCIAGGSARVVHAGDTRCYLVRDGSLTQITTDHTVVARLIEIGELTEAEASTHPQRSTLYRSLGGDRPVEPQITEVDVRHGDWLILTTDGVHGLLASEALVRATTSSTPALAARMLVSEAILAGGHDNATAICIRVLAAAP